MMCIVRRSQQGLWDSLDRKYKTEDARAKKFVIGRFLDFKMVDSKNVIGHFLDFKMVDSKTVIGRFVDFKMVDSKTVMS